MWDVILSLRMILQTSKVLELTLQHYCSKSIDWFLYVRDLCHERAKVWIKLNKKDQLIYWIKPGLVLNWFSCSNHPYIQMTTINLYLQNLISNFIIFVLMNDRHGTTRMQTLTLSQQLLTHLSVNKKCLFSWRVQKTKFVIISTLCKAWP